MARFDLFLNPDGPGYLLDVQADVLDSLHTRVVVPLIPAATAPQPAKYLNPVFDIDAKTHVMGTQFLATVPKSILKSHAGSLASQDTAITRALDVLFTGV